MTATVVAPSEFQGALMELFQERRGDLAEHTFLGPGRTLLRRAPPAGDTLCLTQYRPLHVVIRVVIGTLMTLRTCPSKRMRVFLTHRYIGPLERSYNIMLERSSGSDTKPLPEHLSMVRPAMSTAMKRFP